MIDSPTIYALMQAAVDIVSTSPHPTNKIAATIAGLDGHGKPFALSRVNHWPPVIAEKIGTEPDIGSSSGTIHAEIACILAAPQTAGAQLFITDPPCPNCMKNMAEAGISALYIDHKGFDKDWAKRRGESFDKMSMRIAEKAGLDVYVIHRKEQRFEIISRHAQGYKPPVENPPDIKIYSGSLEDLITQRGAASDDVFTLAIAADPKGTRVSVQADRHPTIGYTSDTIEEKDGKYSFMLQPINRVLMVASKNGLKIKQLYSSRCPTSRELVNVVGAGIAAIKIGDKTAARDEFGPQALKQLIDAGILNLS